MPRCEGLPDKPWPQKANNRSVKLSQGDLMLCPKCDAIRFPPRSASIVTLNSRVTTQNHATNNKIDDHPVELSEINKLITNNIQPDETAAVTHDQLNNASSESSSGISTVTCDKSIECELAAPRAEVQQQRDIISTLQTQLCSVLATLGIADGTRDFPTGTKSWSSVVAANGHNQTSINDSIELHQQSQKPAVNCQQSLIAAVYVD
jgi:hypothetical protein